MNKIKEELSTALVSDILDEEGYKDQMLPINIKPNFPNAKIMGKARIMTLKAISNKKNYQEVYKGLYFLESLDKGDVLIVGKGFEEYAFFGELMSTLAKSRGVEGTIVDGVTRDKLETIRLEYPVFAKNNIGKDIKKRGVVDETDVKSVKIGGVTINKGDMVLGDLDGVIVIPKEIYKKVVDIALKTKLNEEHIKKSIKEGMSVENLLKKYGEF